MSTAAAAASAASAASAAAAAAAADDDDDTLSDALKVLTECQICHKTITAATWLPCVHVFCFACLGSDQPGPSLSCPKCGRFFPATELRVDYFVQDLVDGFRPVTDPGKKTLCEFCEEEEKSRVEGSERNTGSSSASLRCIDCKVNLCDDCYQGHRKHCKSHVIVELEDFRKRRQSISKSVPRCRVHVEEKLKLFCCDCLEVLCVVCYAGGHHRHNCKDISSASSDLKRRLREELQWMDVCKSGLSSTLTDLGKQWNSYEDSVKETRLKIREKSDLLKRIIDDHVTCLYRELDAITENAFIEYRKSTKTLDDVIADLDYVKRYSLVLAENGSESHLASSFHRLHDRAAEVKTRQRPEKNGAVYRKPEIVFAEPDPAERITGETSDVIGHVALTEDPTEDKEDDREAFIELLATLSIEGKGVTGVTLLNNKLYITCAWNNTIFVNDADHPFAKHPSLLVKDMRCPNDVASCTDNCCIYVVDSDNSCVWRVNPAGQSDLWLAKTSQPWTISVNCGRVILASDGKPPHLNIYGPGAGILQRVRLPVSITSIQHAIELPNGHFVVGYGRDSGRTSNICEVSKSGNIVRSFDGGSEPKSTSPSTSLVKWPRHLAFDGRDRVLVAEFSNHYVLVLNGSLQLERVLLSWEDDRVDAPSRLCFVPGTACLLLAEATSVKVFEVHGFRPHTSQGLVKSKRLSLFNPSKK